MAIKRKNLSIAQAKRNVSFKEVTTKTHKLFRKNMYAHTVESITRRKLDKNTMIKIVSNIYKKIQQKNKQKSVVFV